jgi:hypothetical protein
MKFFAQSKVNWNRFRPTDMVFKSNAMVKKIVPSKNILSYSTKSDRDLEMAQRSGGTQQQRTHWNGQVSTYYSRDKYRAVHVKLKDLKSPYPSADLEFVDCTPKYDSVGNFFNNIMALVYITSFHQRSEWVQGANGHYTTKKVGKVAQLDEGYRVAYGGQGDSNYMDVDELEEIAQISRAVKNFLVEVVVPFKEGTLDCNYRESLIENEFNINSLELQSV